VINSGIGTEDYTDWESVDEEAEPEPPSRVKGKRKAVSVTVKKEDENTEVPTVLESKDNVIEGQKPPQNTPAPAAVKKKQSKTSAKTKPQKGLLNFFGPKKN
jgi:DNA polymerase delta subunit 3